MNYSCWSPRRMVKDEVYCKVSSPPLEQFRRTKSLTRKTSSRARISQVIRRSLRLGREKRSLAENCLFNLPLATICDGENLPQPVMSMLQQLVSEGPSTQGIFRRSANARVVRELRDRLDAGDAVAWDDVPVLVSAALFKDFLRSLPDPLLTSELYPQWRDAIDTPDNQDKLFKMKGILSQLPLENRSLLSHTLCMLYHISLESQHNLMSPINLAVCVGPSLLWSGKETANAASDLSVVPQLAEFLISHCLLLCRSHLLSDASEEAYSLWRDDLSVHSLECGLPSIKHMISLSRDSGLNTPDEDGGSSSSSHCDDVFDNDNLPREVRVCGGWERPNAHFQRQSWYRQKSRRAISVPVCDETEEGLTWRGVSTATDV